MIRSKPDRGAEIHDDNKSPSLSAGLSRALVVAVLLGTVLAATTWTAAPRRAAAIEPYFCIELVLSRNWPAARFYCDSAATPGNVGIKLAEGIAYFFGAERPEDVTRAARLWREVPPIAGESEWRNISGVFDPEIDIIERDAAGLDRLAQFKLGVLHETGHFETPDLAAALFRYDQAARANLPEAHIALARIYQKGVESIGVEPDPVKAEQHLLKAVSLRAPLDLRPPQEPSDGGQAVAQAGAGSEGELDELAAAMANAPDAPITASNQQAEDRAAAAAAGVAQPQGAALSDEAPITASNEQAQDRAAAAAAEAVTPPAEPSASATATSDAELAVASSAATNPSAATPTGTLPSGSAESPSAVLAPEVLAALVAAAEESAASQANAAASASAQAVPADGAQSSAATTVPADVETSSAVIEDDVVAEPTEVVSAPATSSPAVPSSVGGGIVRSGVDDRVIVLDPVRVPAATSETGASAEQETGTAVVPEPSTVQAPAAVETEGERPGEGEGRWSPPAEVAALYYPEEELEVAASGATEEPEEIEIASAAPQDAGGAAAGSASASASASAASTSGSASASAGSSRLITVEPFDRSELSCVDTGASGATLAMPVVPDEEDVSGEEATASASHVSDPGALIAIEQGIRAKASGDIDGALAAWTPYARRGNATAQYLVGMLYLTGDAVPRNLRTAYAWFGLAAGQGHQLATCELLRLEQRMSPEDVALAMEQARELSSVSGQ